MSIHTHGPADTSLPDYRPKKNVERLRNIERFIDKAGDSFDDSPRAANDFVLCALLLILEELEERN